MSDEKTDLRQALAWAEEELYHRLKDPELRTEMSTPTLIRAVETLRRQVTPEMEAAALDAGGDGFIGFVRVSGLPEERKVDLVAAKMGVSSEEARTLLSENGDK